MFRGAKFQNLKAFIATKQTKGRKSVWYDLVPSAGKKI